MRRLHPAVPGQSETFDRATYIVNNAMSVWTRPIAFNVK